MSLPLVGSGRPLEVADLFAVRELSLTHPPLRPRPGGTLSQSTLAQQFAEEKIRVPEIANGFLRIVSIQGGFLGSLHAGERTLVLFGAGSCGPANGEVWDELKAMSKELSKAFHKVLPEAPSWNPATPKPRTIPWLCLVPVEGMMWYEGHQEAITTVVREVAGYFLTLSAFGKGLKQSSVNLNLLL